MKEGGADCSFSTFRISDGTVVAFGETLEEMLLVLGESQPEVHLQLGLDGPAPRVSSFLPRELRHRKRGKFSLNI
ncbi:hypothetical protein CEXT_590801 [Caerostris extrusa]|uniref:Uncharacterized protein n=1 Tax=Caerostris extrusa TaxID=172846 RepID=A0AAV4URL8_CAEEX|nr:hypothetical protein CEXT_590801 [Caerostris extrusa]